MNYGKLIDDLGGTSAVAELCQVTTGAVSQWRENGIPHARMMYLRAVRPDVFDEKRKVGAGSTPKQKKAA